MKGRALFYLDLLERTIWTGIQAFAGSSAVEAIDWLKIDLSTSQQFKIAVGAGVLAALKCIASTQLPWTKQDTGSTLPAAADPNP